MKKSLFLSSVFGLAIFLLCGSTTAVAQIPNAGFENWTSGNPDNWWTDNIPGIWAPVTKSTTAHGGSASARLDVIIVPTGGTIAPAMSAGSDMTGFAWTQRSGFITGYYQLFPAAGSGDRISIVGSLLKGGQNGTIIAIGAGYAATATSTWAQFSVPFTYTAATVPDWGGLTFTIVGPGSASGKAGSYCLIDDVSITGTASAVDDAMSLPESFTLEQNYPNPFNPSTTISYTVAQPARVTLKVYNLLGTEVATLMDAPMEAGRYMVRWNAAGLSGGMYVYRMAVTSEKGIVFDRTKKLILVK